MSKDSQDRLSKDIDSIKAFNNGQKNSYLELGKIPDLSLLENKDIASYYHKFLITKIADFESNLGPEQEVAIKLSSFGKEITINVSALGYHNPNIITFIGTVDGSHCELVQNVNQLNFLLLAVPKIDKLLPAKRIGFYPSED